MKYIIYTDGGSRGNPGHAASAFVIKDEEGKTLFSKGEYIGTATNNEAEYTAVIIALEWLTRDSKSTSDDFVEFRADSQLIVNQLAGEWKIKNDRIAVLNDKALKLSQGFGRVKYTYIPRALNFEADAIVNETLDKKLS